MSSLWFGCNITRQHIWIVQVGNSLTYRDLTWSLTILCSVGSSGTQPSHWSCLSPITCGAWWKVFQSPINEGRQKTPNWVDLAHRRSHSGAPENTDIKDTYFNQDLDKNPRKLHSPNQSSLHRITINFSLNRTYRKVRLEREFLPLKLIPVQFPREFAIHHN